MTDLPRLDLTVVTVRSGAGPVPLYGHSDSFVVLETLAPARGDDGCIAIVVGLARSLGCWPAMASAGSLGRDSSSASAALRRGRSAHAGGIAPHTRPEHARRALQELGPTSVKLGQIASTRADLLSPEYQAELARLQDAAPAEPWPTVRAVLVAEVGPRLPDVDRSRRQRRRLDRPTRESCVTGRR